MISFKIDVLGTVDFGTDQLAIDGTMYDSYVVEFQVSGDMAFRLDWGANPEFLVSMGGFNPLFQPPPDVPSLARLSVSIGYGDNPRLSSNSYFAVTSNTLQFGANVDAYASAGGFSVHGYIGFDALFIASPFSFEIDFSAGFDISYDGHSLAGIQLDASLSGPRPWHLHGDASFNILFFSVSASLDLTWGDSTPAVLPSQPVLPPLLAALGDPRNWSVALPASAMQSVTLRTIPPDPTKIVVHPLGSLSVRETVVPLDFAITLFNGATPSDGTEFDITSVTLNGTPVTTVSQQEDFAIAQFTSMSDADKLSAPSFELFDAGVSLGAAPIANSHDSAHRLVPGTLHRRLPGRLAIRQHLQHAVGSARRAGALGPGRAGAGGHDRSRQLRAPRHQEPDRRHADGLSGRQHDRPDGAHRHPARGHDPLSGGVGPRGLSGRQLRRAR